MSSITICEADLDNEEHVKAYLALTAKYIVDEMGGGVPWTPEQKVKLIKELKEHPSRLLLLVKYSDQFAGVCSCFKGYSTFLAGGLINIHDIFVDKNYRGKGLGRALMQAVQQKAMELGCVKITLEVRKDNIVAQQLYKEEGYGDATPPMLFWAKYL